jgi:Flp pilus assembly protein TadG
MFMKDESGSTLSEFAIISPFLFLILFGIIEFSTLLYDKAMITNASREGARAGIVFSHPNRLSNAEIENVVNNYCSTYLISFDSAPMPPTTLITRAGDESGDPLRVAVSYQFRFLVFSNLVALVGGGTGNSVNLSAETVMRME